jgi:lysyl-tRNA synthetase class 2
MYVHWAELLLTLPSSYDTILNKDGQEYRISWKRPWKRIEMLPGLEEATGVKFPAPEELGSDESIKFLEGLLSKLGLECPIKTPAKMLDKLAGEYLEPQLINPGFIIGHPQM